MLIRRRLINAVIRLLYCCGRLHGYIYLRNGPESLSCKNLYSDHLKVTGGTWSYKINNGDFTEHTYFSPGVAKSLKRSIVLSDGKEITLISKEFNYSLIRVHWSGRRIYSFNNEIDMEYSIGKIEYSRDEEKKFHIYNIKNSYLFAQRNSTNYYHFIIEILSSLIIWQEKLKPDHVLIMCDTSFTVEAVRLCGFSNPIKLIPANSLLLLNKTTITNLLPAGYLNLNLIKEIQSRFIKNTSSQKLLPKVRPTIVFLGRLASEGRLLNNEKEVYKIIKKYFSDIMIVYPGELQLAEQVCILSEAKVIISIHGAQATNILWAPKLEIYIEISCFLENLDFINLANLLGIVSHRVESTLLDKKNLWSNHECNLYELETVIKNLKHPL